jgi:hypothetical protein
MQLLYRYNSDLQVTDTDTIHAIRGQSASRVKMCQAGPGQFAVAMNIQEASGRWIMRYELRDNSLKVLKTTDDTTGSYQAFLIGLQVTRCSDGGYFYAAARYAPPSFSLDCYFEKRDADFNLLWRAEYGGNTNERPSTIMEFGGNHVSYGIGAHPDDPSKQSLFILWYDNNGKLIKEKFLDGGGVDFKLNEQMVRTEDGGFLATSSTSLGATSNNSKTILYKIDENLEIKEIKLFGSNSGVLHGDILKVDVNKYLLLYGDNGFEGEQGAARYITIYVDQNGGIIKG